MIKKYFSKYTGQQIDEAVSALIENNVRIEDLNQEVLDLIKKGGVEIVDIPNSIIEKILSNESVTTAIPLSDEEFEFFTTDYEQRVYRLNGDSIIFGVPGTILFRFLMKATIEEENEEIFYFGGNDFISFQIATLAKTLTTSLAMALEGALGVSDLEWKTDQIQVHIDGLETEVSNVSSVASNAEYLAYENQTAIEELKASVEDLAGSGESTPTPIPEGEWVDKIYFNHNLSTDEVKAICDQITTFRLGSACQYDILRTETLTIGIQGDYDSNSPSQVSNYRMFVWGDTQYFEFDPYSGWQTGKNGDGSYEIEEDIVTVGQNNDILINLVSTTPFNSKPGRVGELETAVEELHNEISELEELIGDSNSVVSYEKGTTVPNQGYLEKVYLNDSLTSEEVDSILDGANIEFYSTPGGYDIYELLRTNKVNNWPETIISIYKYNFSEENYGYIITTNKYTQHYPLYISPTLTDLSDVIINNNYEKRGWMFDSSNGEDNVSNPCYIVGYPHNELQTTGIWTTIGLNNDAITSIISATPFVKQAINETKEELTKVNTKVEELTNSITSLLESPTVAVPSSGTLENIYIRIPTSDTWYITDEKFIAVCEQLNFRLGSSCVYTVVTTTNANIWIGGYWNSTLQKVESFYVMASSSAGERVDFEDGSYGFVGINEEITSAGTQNDLLKDYFSITPFEKSLPEKVDALEKHVEEINSKLEGATGTTVLLDAPSLAEDYSALLSGSSYVRRELTDDEVIQFTELATSDKYIGLGTNVTVDGVTASAVMYKGVYESLNNELTVTTQFGEWLILGYVNLTDKDIYLWYVSLDDIAAIKTHLYGDVYTKTEVNNIIGDINSLLDQINGEVM